MLVGGQVCNLFQNFLLHRPRGTRIQDDLDAVFSTEGDDILDCLLGDLMLEQDDLALQKGILHFVHVVDIDMVVCACNDYDRIVVVTNRDHGQPGGHPCNRLDAFCLNACVLQVL